MLPIPQDSIALYSRTHPNRKAATELVTGENWSYRQLDQAVARVVALLEKRGCSVGDRVAVLARNSVSQVIIHFACARAGLIYLPLNWRFPEAEIHKILEISSPALLLCDAICGASLEDGGRFEDLGKFMSESRGKKPKYKSMQQRSCASLLLFTSGTSGLPKGVLLSERNLLETAINFSMLTSIDSKSCFLCEAPMFHVIGMVTNVRPVLQQGGSIVVSDGFDAKRTLDWFADSELGITHYVGVPQMVEAFRQMPNFNIDHVRKLTAIVTGGAPHKSQDIAAWLDDGVSLVSGFGMSEAGTVFGMTTDIEVIRSKLGSVGVSAPGVITRLVDDEGNDCMSTEAGELWLRGDNITIGYWQNEAQNRAAFTEDGWFKTGDIARCDEDGYFWIVDRKKDMFISGGENVYPAEIEALLSDYPGVQEAAVVGIPDDVWGEVGCLVIVPEGDEAPDFENIASYLKSNLAGYKVPKKHITMADLPRTSTGKLQKAILKKRIVSEL